MYIEISKLEVKITEDNLTEIVWTENKENFIKNKISNFKIKLSNKKIEITGYRKFLFNIPFHISGKLKLLKNMVEFEVEKVRFAKLLKLSPESLTSEILEHEPKNVCKGKENSILINILAEFQYPVKIELRSIDIFEGYLILRT